MQLTENFFNNRRLETLVENQTTYSLNNAEMHVFETHQDAERVLLQFHETVLASMITGKKVMHLEGLNSFEFLPGESLILPHDELMCIDFPEAKMDNPTRCLAMTISDDKIKQVVLQMNEQLGKADNGEWEFTDHNFHFTNDLAIHQIINRLLFLFTENHESKDFFVDLMLKELIVRLLQTENRKIYQENAISLSGSNRLAYVVQFIKDNIMEDISVKRLSEKAAMSESTFHRVFKNEFGMSPVNYINQERLRRAGALLKLPDRPIKNVFAECGFNSMSYFNRQFKKAFGLSPSDYRKSYLKDTRLN